MYHSPVLLKESVDALQINPNGIYVDVTFGGGGHSSEILSRLSNKGKLFSFDQDDDAIANAHTLTEKIINEKTDINFHKNFTFIALNFKDLANGLARFGIDQVDGILADLGVSSHQFDTPMRGFSTRFDAPLDMRMNQNIAITAEEVINNYPEKKLHKIFELYGEVKNAKTLANAIISTRLRKRIVTTEDLKDILNKFTPQKTAHKYHAQVFQALRIEVNEEMKVLEEMLLQTADLLKIGGKLVVLSYHSLEDRLVKNFIQKGKFEGEVEKDFFGNELKPFKNLTKKPLEPSSEEISTNSRARSAKMRVAEKL